MLIWKVQPQRCWWVRFPSPPPGRSLGRTWRAHVTGVNAVVPSRLLPVQSRADKARVTGKVGCSQHHLEAKSCWLLHPFIASLVIIRDAKAQTAASSLAVEHPHHSQVSPCLTTTYCSSPSCRTLLPPRAALAWPGLSSSGSAWGPYRCGWGPGSTGCPHVVVAEMLFQGGCQGWSRQGRATSEAGQGNKSPPCVLSLIPSPSSQQVP